MQQETDHWQLLVISWACFFFVRVIWASCYLGWIEGNLDHLYDTYTERCLEGNIWHHHKLSGTSSQSLSVAPFLNNKAPGQKKTVHFISSSYSGTRCMFGAICQISQLEQLNRIVILIPIFLAWGREALKQSTSRHLERSLAGVDAVKDCWGSIKWSKMKILA